MLQWCSTQQRENSEVELHYKLINTSSKTSELN